MKAMIRIDQIDSEENKDKREISVALKQIDAFINAEHDFNQFFEKGIIHFLIGTFLEIYCLL